MSTIPTITEQDIRSLVGEANFQRGERYFRSGSIFETRRQGMTLKARCQGSRASAYHVEATFNDTGIASTGCSCPIGGYCKHVAALLLTWLKQPDEFVEQQDIDSVLEQYDKAELISLVKQMLRREPDLEDLVLTMHRQDTPVDPALFRRQVETAFRRAGNEWGAEAEVADELSAIQESADSFAQRRDYASAITGYNAIVAGIIEHHYEYRDGDGELHTVISACVETLGNWLDEVQGDSILRERILRILFSIYNFDIQAGGIAFGEDASTILSEQTTAQERQTIASWVREAIAASKKDASKVRYFLGGAAKTWAKQAGSKFASATLNNPSHGLKTSWASASQPAMATNMPNCSKAKHPSN